MRGAGPEGSPRRQGPSSDAELSAWRVSGGAGGGRRAAGEARGGGGGGGGERAAPLAVPRGSQRPSSRLARRPGSRHGEALRLAATPRLP